MHAVHIDLSWEWLPFSLRGHISLLVLVKWHLDFDLLFSALVDRFGETEEAGMRTSCLFWNKILVCMLVDFLHWLAIALLNVASKFIVLRSHTILNAQDWTRRCLNQLDVSSIAKELV